MWFLIKQLLFRLDAETAHNLSHRILKLVSLPNKKIIEAITGAGNKYPNLKTTVMGIDFDSPVGLAAGFDKNAEFLPLLEVLGFSYAELGTVTPRPQGGNPRPRLFREPSERALFNQMGFNNLGAFLVAENIKKYRSELSDSFRIGINIGKNKDTPNEEAYRDYQKAIQYFDSLVDYVTINVSSPNTPGLRDLQNTQSLTQIIDAVQEEISKWSKKVPLCLKIAPENSVEQLQSFAQMEKKWGLDAWILCNTLRGSYDGKMGGWSGAPLTEDSVKILEKMKPLTQLPIISVGGIMTPQDAEERFQLGAQLIQIYTGWIYGGPRFPDKIKRFLSERDYLLK